MVDIFIIIFFVPYQRNTKNPTFFKKVMSNLLTVGIKIREIIRFQLYTPVPQEAARLQAVKVESFERLCLINPELTLIACNFMCSPIRYSVF